MRQFSLDSTNCDRLRSKCIKTYIIADRKYIQTSMTYENAWLSIFKLAFTLDVIIIILIITIVG